MVLTAAGLGAGVDGHDGEAVAGALRRVRELMGAPLLCSGVEPAAAAGGGAGSAARVAKGGTMESP